MSHHPTGRQSSKSDGAIDPPASGLVWRTAFYLLGGVLQKVGYLLLLPILARDLGPAEYTRFGLAVTAIIAIDWILTLNVQISPSRLFFDFRNPRRRSDLLKTCLVLPLASSVLGGGLILLALQATGLREPISTGRLDIQLAVGAAIVATVFVEFVFVVMRIRGRAGAFTIASVFQTAGLLAAYFSLAGVLPDPLLRAVVSLAVARGSAGVIGLAFSLRSLYGGTVRRTMARRAVRFSLPITVHLLATWAVSQSTPWIGAKYVPLDELADYTVVIQVSLAAMMVIVALFQARTPEIGSAFGLGEYHRGERIVRRTALLAGGCIFAVYLAALVVLYGLQIPVPQPFQQYVPSAELLILAGAVNLLQVAAAWGSQVLLCLKRTDFQAKTTVPSAAITILLGFVLASQFGKIGLIVAALTGQGIQAAATNWIALRQFRSATGGHDGG